MLNDTSAIGERTY